MRCFKIAGPITLLLKKSPGLKTLTKWFPKGFTFIITFLALTSTLVTAIKTGQPVLFFKELGIKIFLSDMSLQTTVETLKTTQPLFLTRISLLIQSIGDIMMIYYLNKGVAKIYASITGAGGAWVGYWITSFTVLGAIEFAVAAVVKDQLIVPYMGIFMLIMNLPLFIDPVLNSYENFLSTTNYLETQNKTIVDYITGNYNETVASEFSNQSVT